MHFLRVVVSFFFFFSCNVANRPPEILHAHHTSQNIEGPCGQSGQACVPIPEIHRSGVSATQLAHIRAVMSQANKSSIFVKMPL